jgi:acetate kinase
LHWLDLQLDSIANAANKSQISVPGSLVTALVIPTDEEQVMADESCSLLLAFQPKPQQL